MTLYRYSIICLSIHLLMNIWLVSSLAIVNKTGMNIFVQSSCGHMLSFVSCSCLGVDCLGHTEEVIQMVSQVVVPFYISTSTI